MLSVPGGIDIKQLQVAYGIASSSHVRHPVDNGNGKLIKHMEIIMDKVELWRMLNVLAFAYGLVDHPMKVWGKGMCMRFSTMPASDKPAASDTPKKKFVGLSTEKVGGFSGLRGPPPSNPYLPKEGQYLPSGFFRNMMGRGRPFSGSDESELFWCRIYSSSLISFISPGVGRYSSHPG